MSMERRLKQGSKSHLSIGYLEIHFNYLIRRVFENGRETVTIHEDGILTLKQVNDHIVCGNKQAINF